MEDWLVKLLLLLFGLYSGVMSLLFRTVWNDLKHMKEDNQKIHEELIELKYTILLQIKEQYDAWLKDIEKLIETKFVEGFTKMELNWINEGRIKGDYHERENHG